MSKKISATRWGLVAAGEAAPVALTLLAAVLPLALASRPAFALLPPGLRRSALIQATPGHKQAMPSKGPDTPSRTEATSSPFTLTASMERRSAPEGRPVVLTLSLHNNSTERLMIGGSAFEQSAFRITVTDGAGRAVPRTSLGERALTPPTMVFANATVMISPDQTLRYRFNLARLFDLSRAGDYDVSVSRTIAPWYFPVSPPKAGRPAPPTGMNLVVGPIKFRMIEDANATSGPTALVPPPAHQTFLYMANRYSPGISRYRIGEDGTLSLAFAPGTDNPYALAPDPAVGTGTDSLVTTPDRHYLYTSDSVGVVSQFSIEDDGVLLPLSPPTVLAVKRPGRWYSTHPGPLLVNPRGRFLYNLTGALYSIGTGGRLTPLPPSPPDTCYTVGPDGRLTTLPRPPWTASYAVSPDGQLTMLSQPVPGPAGPDGGPARAVALSPSGRFAFVLTSTSFTRVDDLVVPMRVGADGTLTPLPGAQKPQTPPLPSPGIQPFSCTALAVDPTGRFLVVVNPGFLDCYRIGTDGSLTPLGMTTVQGDLDSILFVPGGRLAYAHNSNPNSLLAFRLDDRRGLAPAEVAPPNDVPFDAGIPPVIVVIPTPAKWGPDVGGLEISARLPVDVPPTGAPVVMTVVLRNNTTQPIPLGKAGMDMSSFRLSLIGPQQQSSGVLRGSGEPAAAEIRLLAAGRDLLDTPAKGGAPLVLPPGRERQYRFALSRLADLTIAGNYTIQIKRVLLSGITAVSPVLHILLEGPYDGIMRIGPGETLQVE